MTAICNFILNKTDNIELLQYLNIIKKCEKKQKAKAEMHFERGSQNENFVLLYILGHAMYICIVCACEYVI